MTYFYAKACPLEFILMNKSDGKKMNQSINSNAESVVPVTPKVPLLVVFNESDDSNKNTQSTPSPKPSFTVPQTKPSQKKANPVRFKIPRKEAQNLPFDVYDAYNQHVDLAELMDELSKTIRRFIIIDSVQADAASLWVLHTYLVSLFDTSPILIINAPERACAKTLFQTVLSRLVCRALAAANATPSALFRSVELWMPTILFDEADTFFKDKLDLQGMVNAGYNASGFVLRSEVEGDSFIPRKFSVYSAKSIAGIALEKHLPDATMSRGIVLNMRRKLSDETVERLRYAESGLFETLCAKLERAADDYEEAIQNARPSLPDELSDRAQDSWEPLLAIAMVAGDEWLERAKNAALTLSRRSSEKVSTGNELLADIQQVFELNANGGQYDDKISSVSLIEALVKIPESPWATYNHGHPLSPRQLSSQLAIYDIHSKTVRIGPFDTPKGYALSQFKDAFTRYLTPAEDDTLLDDEPSTNKPKDPNDDDLY